VRAGRRPRNFWIARHDRFVDASVCRPAVDDDLVEADAGFEVAGAVRPGRKRVEQRGQHRITGRGGDARVKGDVGFE